MSTTPVPPAYPPPSYVPFPDPAQEWRDSTQLSILQDIVQSQQKQLEDQQEILLAQQQELQGTKDKIETMHNELGGVLLPDGRVVFVPGESATIGLYDPSPSAARSKPAYTLSQTLPPSWNVALLPYYNKY